MVPVSRSRSYCGENAKTKKKETSKVRDDFFAITGTCNIFYGIHAEHYLTAMPSALGSDQCCSIEETTPFVSVKKFVQVKLSKILGNTYVRCMYLFFHTLAFAQMVLELGFSGGPQVWMLCSDIL